MVVIYTHLGITPLPLVILVNVLLFIGIFSRMIPSQALISASFQNPLTAGSFMVSVSSSIQQVSGGIASNRRRIDCVWNFQMENFLHFDVIGYVLVGTSLTTINQVMYFIHRRVVLNK